MEIGYPVAMIILPLAAALVSLLVGRFRKAQVFVALTALAFLWLPLFFIEPSELLFPESMTVIFGRGLDLTSEISGLFLIIYPAVGLLIGWQWIRPSESALIPAGLAILAPMAGALLITNRSLGATCLLLAAGFAVPALYGGRYGAASSVWRYFLMACLAIGPLLIAVWFITIGQADQMIAHLGLLLAVLIILAGFPFHIWITGLIRHTPPMAWLLVLGLIPFAGVFFLHSILGVAPSLRTAPEFRSALQWSAVLTALLGSFMMMRARQGRELFVYAVILDAAFMLPVLLSPAVSSYDVALMGLLGRYAGLVLVAIGLSLSPHSTSLGPMRGKWRDLAILPKLFKLFGLLTLIGLPLTPGFPGRWAQIRVAAALSPAGAIPWVPALLLLALALGAIAVYRASTSHIDTGDEETISLGRGGHGLLLILLGSSVFLGLFPHLLVRFSSGGTGVF